MNDPCTEWGDCDDTLDDGGVAREVPPEARPWLAEQQFVHGLLRHMHSADAQSREARVQGILGALPAPRAALLRQRLLVAAAALLFAVGGWWLLHGGRNVVTAEAAVRRAASVLGEQVDRRFTLDVRERKTDRADRSLASFELTTRPGMHFLLVGGPQWLVAQNGPLRTGCDGAQVWLRPAMSALPTMAVPLDKAVHLLAMAGDVLDLGYLDLQALMQRLPEGFELETVGRESGADGRRLLHVAAARLPDRLQERLQSVQLWCDEGSGMVTRIEIEVQGRGREQRLVTLQYIGTVAADASIYGKP